MGTNKCEPNHLYVVKDPMFSLLIQKLNEYIKVVRIAMVQILGSIEDEKTCNNLVFMKSKLYNQLTTHNFYTISIFFNEVTIITWKKVCIKYHVDG